MHKVELPTGRVNAPTGRANALTLNIIRHEYLFRKFEKMHRESQMALACYISTLRKELAALKAEEQKEAEFAYYLRHGKFPN